MPLASARPATGCRGHCACLRLWEARRSPDSSHHIRQPGTRQDRHPVSAPVAGEPRLRDRIKGPGEYRIDPGMVADMRHRFAQWRQELCAERAMQRLVVPEHPADLALLHAGPLEALDSLASDLVTATFADGEAVYARGEGTG